MNKELLYATKGAILVVQDNIKALNGFLENENPMDALVLLNVRTRLDAQWHMLNYIREYLLKDG